MRTRVLLEHARDVVGETASGDVGHRVDGVHIEEWLELSEIAAVAGEKDVGDVPPIAATWLSGRKASCSKKIFRARE